MQMRKMAGMTGMAMAAILLLAGGMAMADITIETVPVGNAGNAADDTGHGSVAYDYNIGKCEVTAEQYTQFLNAVAGVDAYSLYNAGMWSDAMGCKIERHGGSGTSGDPYQYQVAGLYANRPVNYISWGSALRFANWLTNGQGNGDTETGAYNLNGAMTDTQFRAVAVPSADQRATWSIGDTSYFLLPSESEWYKAAYHKNDGATGNYFNYPTSSDEPPGRDLNDASGNNANYKGDPYPIDSPYYTTPVGQFQDSDSPYGTFDQGGNVYEWNEAVRDVSFRGLRGGSFFNVGGVNDLLASTRGRSKPWLAQVHIGFRVSVVGEPGSMALIGDADGNGVVDAADFITLKKNFNQPGAEVEQGNFTGDDGFVDWDDLSTLMTNMGAREPGPAAVPEPATLGLLAIGALAIIQRRRS